jgi:hypothetical protein
MATPQIGQYVVSSKTKMLSIIGMVIGASTLGAGLAMEHERIWQAFLLNLFYFTSLTLGGLFFTAVLHAAKAGWSATIRRVSESLTSFIPYSFVGAMLVVFVGGKSLYEWMNPEVVANDELLQKKAAYLNHGFFSFRTILFFAIWFVFAKLIVGNSLKQDAKADDSLTLKNLKLSIAFLICFALSYSLFSVDFVMSLNPHWFSTIFGVYCFAGLFQSTLALLIIIIVALVNQGALKNVVNENHFHDLGKFLFAFTVFYAYIAFSQFMLVWYANLPEETIFYIHRAQGVWLAVSYSLLVLKFVVPFFLLAPREAKRNTGHLSRVAWLIMIMQMVDFYWLIYPNFNEGKAVYGIWELGLTLGFAGAFTFAVTKFLSKNKVVPVNDPYMHEALHHHI